MLDSVERESLPPDVLKASIAAQVPKGCKGAACPAFAVCQGRCAVLRMAREQERQVPVVIQ